MRCNASGYGAVALALHWLVAALAVAVVSLGWAGDAAPRGSPGRANLLLLHRSFGLTILALVAIRVLWRWRQPPPALPAGIGPMQAWLAHLTHFGLYLVLIMMPAAGYLNAAAAGHAVSFFGIASIPPLLPVDARLSQFAIAAHLIGQYLLYVLVSLHLLGALYHGFIRRDGVLERMLPRRRRRV